ncbi:hypothetical protein TELCIR_15583 [Teladorsagia circumcincta]|uniref:RRM domain-containing protein n=1 Tax=Teladorsagia circumcincta TaxID=45464 RepID=A0A2G9U038_TELCI|nr:hypothetical protein TELCIR_15583 [Teladorsagia circumcincta]
MVTTRSMEGEQPNNPATTEEVKLEEEQHEEQNQVQEEQQSDTEENGKEKDEQDQDKEQPANDQDDKDSVDGKKLPQTSYVRLRGLPYSAKESDIRDFFEGIEVTTITMSSSHNGRPSGECYCELPSKKDALKALDLHRKEMEGRYIEVQQAGRYVEVFRTTVDDMERNRPRSYESGYIRPLFDSKGYDYMARSPRSMRGMRSAPYDIPRGGYGRYDDYDDFVPPTKIFMRGLPFDADAFMIEQFFAPLRCIEISLGFNEDRRPSGDAVVEFGTTAEAHEAFSRNKAMMGKRYVELFGSNDMPHTMRRLTWRVVGGQPAPRPLALVPPRDLGGYGGGYGGMRGGGGYSRGYEPAGPGPFRGYGGGGYGGGGGGSRSRDRRGGVW